MIGQLYEELPFKVGVNIVWRGVTGDLCSIVSQCICVCVCVCVCLCLCARVCVYMCGCLCVCLELKSSGTVTSPS